MTVRLASLGTLVFVHLQATLFFECSHDILIGKFYFTLCVNAPCGPPLYLRDLGDLGLVAAGAVKVDDAAFDRFVECGDVDAGSGCQLGAVLVGQGFHLFAESLQTALDDGVADCAARCAAGVLLG